MKLLALLLLVLAFMFAACEPAPVVRAPKKTNSTAEMQAVLDEFTPTKDYVGRYTYQYDSGSMTIFDTATARLWVFAPKVTNGWVGLPSPALR